MLFCCEDFNSVSSVEAINTKPECKPLPCTWHAFVACSQPDPPERLPPQRRAPRRPWGWILFSVTPAAAGHKGPHWAPRELCHHPGAPSSSRHGQDPLMWLPRGQGAGGDYPALGQPQGPLVPFLHADKPGGRPASEQRVPASWFRRLAVYLNDFGAGISSMFLAPRRVRFLHESAAVWW